MKFRRLLAAAILAIAVAAPTIELFDHWDHTLQDGNDVEGSCLVVGLCVGFAVAVASVRARARTILAPAGPVVPLPRRLTRGEPPPAIVPFPGISPPVPLRI